MAKNLKLHIKNTQLAEAINLRGLKARLSRKKGSSEEEEKEEPVAPPSPEVVAPPAYEEVAQVEPEETPPVEEPPAVVEVPTPVVEEVQPVPQAIEEPVAVEAPVEMPVVEAPVVAPPVVEEVPLAPAPVLAPAPAPTPVPEAIAPLKPKAPPPFVSAARNNPERLGPVFGREIPQTYKPRPRPTESVREKEPADSSRRVYEPFKERRPPVVRAPRAPEDRRREQPSERTERPRPRTEGVAPERLEKQEGRGERPPRGLEEEGARRPRTKPPENKAKVPEGKSFFKKGEGHTGDSRLRRGITTDDEDETGWRKRRPSKGFRSREQQPEVTRPTKIKVRLPISVKDLAAEMKLKASQLISSLFLQGTVVTLNDLLADDTMVQLLGSELGCEVEIDTSEEQRLRITDKTISEEIHAESADALTPRPPVVTFMGHVDHGKTSLIDAIRKTHRADNEVGAITQHIGAFTCVTEHGPVAFIDTPGHEAFSAMRERGAGLTDIVVLVVAGDEGMKEQTIEALQQAKESKATIIVAVNKADKPNFDQERVFRQMADHELLPEAWGGKTVAVACSAVTSQGIAELLEMIALQAEVLELRANPNTRARGTVIESEMKKGIGVVATILVQNGTLHLGDSLVFGSTWARVKAMRNDVGAELTSAGPSTPVRISGLSGLPSAGEEFIVVKSEKEAKDIAESRKEGLRQQAFQATRRVSLESMIQKASEAAVKKVLTLVLRADVQGSLEALKTALMKIESNKVDLNIISAGVGEISESDVQLASTSNATIIGFHTGIEAHAEPMVKELGVSVRLHEIIYHAQDDVRDRMRATLDRVAEEQERGKAEVKALFKSSQLGIIAGCMVLDGTITRNCSVRVRRGGEVIWNGPVSSLKRFKDDVKEVSKGTECGIVLQGFSTFQEGDVLEGYEVVYHEQEL